MLMTEPQPQLTVCYDLLTVFQPVFLINSHLMVIQYHLHVIGAFKEFTVNFMASPSITNRIIFQKVFLLQKNQDIDEHQSGCRDGVFTMITFLEKNRANCPSISLGSATCLLKALCLTYSHIQKACRDGKLPSFSVLLSFILYIVVCPAQLSPFPIRNKVRLKDLKHT